MPKTIKPTMKHTTPSEGMEAEMRKDLETIYLLGVRDERQRILESEIMKEEPDDGDAFAKDEEIAHDNLIRNELRKSIISLIKGRE